MIATGGVGGVTKGVAISLIGWVLWAWITYFVGTNQVPPVSGPAARFCLAPPGTAKLDQGRYNTPESRAHCNSTHSCQDCYSRTR